MSKNKKSYFISIEGVEGAGKSTAIEFIKKYLAAYNISCKFTREPGGTEIAEAIREVILSHYQEEMCPYTELLLYFAGRAQHVTKVIKPALAAGQWVVSDRFTDASFAYQGIGRNLPHERIATLADWIHADCWPDLVLVLDVDPEIGLERTRKCRKLDRIEAESLPFFQRVRAYYLACAAKSPERYKLVDASKTPEEVNAEIKEILYPIIQDTICE
ncbi:MAG: dTMP kinase [Gammaproteobacteria bacterium]|nr:dTMP kinase [Gammaproteobacteria bacterium]